MKKLFCMLILLMFCTVAYPVWNVPEDTDFKFPIKLVDATDGYTGETGKAFGDTTVQYAENGANSWTAYTDDATTFIEVGNGHYWLKIGASEFNDPNVAIQVRVSVSGCRDAAFQVYTTYQDIGKIATTDDGGAINVASGIVEANIEQLQDQTIATPTTNGVLEVDITHVGGSAIPVSTATLLSDAATASEFWNTASGSATEDSFGNILDDITKEKTNSGTYVLADDAIDPNVVATDTIDADSIANDAVTEITTGVKGFDNTTVSSATDATTFVIADGVVADDVYNGFLITVTDADGDNDPEPAFVKDYVSSSKTITLNTALSFTPASGDVVRFMAGFGRGSGVTIFRRKGL